MLDDGGRNYVWGQGLAYAVDVSGAVQVYHQPDSLAGSPSAPQTLNRYSYALNNPVNYTDPSGHIPVLLVASIPAA